MMFTPDFFLPEYDTYIEITTMDQKLITKKNYWSFLFPISAYWDLGNTPFERQFKYREFLKQSLSHEETEKIRKSLSRGVPKLN